METIKIQEAIKNALSAVRAHGLAVPAEIEKSVAGIENPVYRVAVVGKFQVGKSTLINKVFLGCNSLLPNLAEGNGIQCKTAVATDVEYGETAKLEVYNWSATGGEELVMTKENPTVEDVEAATVGHSEDERSELAKKVSRVRLITPNESLKGYVLLDTPGLDDPNQELLLKTTYRTIPSADVALLVVEPKMLDGIVDDLLRKVLIDQGISRLMVLVSYKPNDMQLSRENRQAVVKTVKDQLAKIGRSDIGVEMYCFDSSVDGVINNVSELQRTISAFLNENALPGRLARVAFEVRQYLEGVELEIVAKIKAQAASEAEKTALKEKVETQIADFKATCERSFRRLQSEMESLKNDAARDVDSRIHKVFSGFTEKLEHARDISEIRTYFGRAESSLKNEISVEVNAVGMTIKSEIGRIVDRYNDGLTDVFAAWNGFLCDEFEIKRPFLAKIPPILIEAIMVLIYDYFLPLGTLTALLGHLFGKKALGLTPDVVLTPIIIAQARGKIAEAEEQIRTQIGEQICANVDSAFLKIKEGIETYNKAQVDRMQKAFCSGTVTVGRSELEQTKSIVALMIDSLR